MALFIGIVGILVLALIVLFFFFPAIIGIVISIVWAISLHYLVNNVWIDEEKNKLLAIGLTFFISGLVFGVIMPIALQSNPRWTEFLVILGIIFSLQVGLSLLLMLQIKSLAPFIGYLATAIILYPLVLTHSEIFEYQLHVKLNALITLVLAASFVSRSIFMERETYFSIDISDSFYLRKGWIRYTINILGILLTLVEFIIILLDLLRS